MCDNINSISSFEMFSNELLMDIFEFISTSDLYNAFFGLNARFNSLLGSLYNLHHTLHEDWDTKNIIIPFFASRIATLIIKHDELVDLSYFSNLRSLKLCRPTVDQCNAIQPHLLPNLEHLYVSNTFFSDNSKELCRHVFSSSFPHLRTCQIDKMTFVEPHHQCSLSLRLLTISPCMWKSDMYARILRACPKLVHLRIIFFRHESFEIPPKFIHSHTHLRRLDICFNSIREKWHTTVDTILSTMPNLEYFIFHIEQNELDTEFPFDSFARMLIQRVPKLHNFNAKIVFNKLPIAKLDSIEQFHPLFVHAHFLIRQSRHTKTILIISSNHLIP